MSPVEWAAFAVFAGFIIASACRLPRLWRDEAPGLKHMPEGWPWGPPGWRAFVRAVPSATIFGIGTIITIPILIAAPEQSGGTFTRSLGVILPFVVVFVLGVLAMLGTALFNWPKALVPPHLRDQQGAASELLRARRGR